MLNLQYIAKKRERVPNTNLGKGVVKHKRATTGKKVPGQGSSEAQQNNKT
jgi:hypothetical protein